MIKFGTGGWRAVIAEEFTFKNVRLLSQALAVDIRSKDLQNMGVVIGYDSRFLSDRFAQTVAQVLAANQIKVYFIKRVSPTPLIMFTVREKNVPYGVIVTASHNPAEYNGIKIITHGGRDASIEVTNELERIAQGLCEENIKIIDFENGIEEGYIKLVNPTNEYIDNIISMLNLNKIKENNLNLLIDPMYGAAKTTLQMLLSSLRCHVDVIHDRFDANFGGRLPSPSSETLLALKNIVLEKNYDMGIATDGDADRLGIISSKGEFIHPNQILVLLYHYLLSYKKIKGGVVRNLVTTHILDKIAKVNGEEVFEVPVGFKYISNGVIQNNALIGGESSGGLMVRGNVPGKDGIYAAGLMVEMLCMTGKKISELLDEVTRLYGKVYFSENNIRLTPHYERLVKKKVYEEKAYPQFDIKVVQVSYMDGLKIYFDEGWVCIRFSGTEPIIRIFAEMPDECQLEYVIEKMKEFIGV